MKRLLSFPNPVNDAAARTVALGVVAMSLVALLGDLPWMMLPLTYGFVARVLTGPTLSPLGQFATRVAGPRLGAWRRDVAGPPKRFAQGIGAALSIATCAIWWTDGWSVARWFLLPLIVAASLEGLLGYCVGCAIFGRLVRYGLVPESICAECGDLRQRFAAFGAHVVEKD